MAHYQFIFEKGSKKHTCPGCGKKRFVRYVDTITGGYLPKQFGRCDRESKCGFYRNPYKEGYTGSVFENTRGNECIGQTSMQYQLPSISYLADYIPDEVLYNSRSNYESNKFVRNLLTTVPFPFEANDVERVISLYHLGTVPETGGCSFPFIDIYGNVRAMQEKFFDNRNHTDKTKQYHTGWIHSRLTNSTYRNKPLPEWLEYYNRNPNKVACPFGEHLLLKYPHHPIAIVEAPKTAIYGSLYFGLPEMTGSYIWMAVGGLGYLNSERCKALKGRDVYLFPDLSENGFAFELWSKKAKELELSIEGSRFYVSDLLEKLASKNARLLGKDLADYLINMDWRKFRVQNNSGNLISEGSIGIGADSKKSLPNKGLTLTRDDHLLPNLKYVADEYLARYGTWRERHADREWMILERAVMRYEQSRAN